MYCIEEIQKCKGIFSLLFMCNHILKTVIIRRPFLENMRQFIHISSCVLQSFDFYVGN